jgi:hypothetical protein
MESNEVGGQQKRQRKDDPLYQRGYPANGAFSLLFDQKKVLTRFDLTIHASLIKPNWTLRLSAMVTFGYHATA